MCRAGEWCAHGSCFLTECSARARCWRGGHRIATDSRQLCRLYKLQIRCRHCQVIQGEGSYLRPFTRQSFQGLKPALPES